MDIIPMKQREVNKQRTFQDRASRCEVVTASLTFVSRESQKAERNSEAHKQLWSY